MLLVMCNSCRAHAFTIDHGYPDRAVECDCCPDSHDHGENANETGVPCRPVTITVVPGSATLDMGA
jgi:hypothetical protein